jgi:hypothetical protein
MKMFAGIWAAAVALAFQPDTTVQRNPFEENLARRELGVWTVTALTSHIGSPPAGQTESMVWACRGQLT